MINKLILGLIGLSLVLLSNSVTGQQTTFPSSSLVQVKSAAFTDPNIGYLYRVTSYNVTSMPAAARYRSIIRVSRYKLSEATRLPIGQPENVQTINFHPTLVDFDLHCLPTHCYMVAVTSKSKQNVELYSWQRTQFDLIAERDSFARPHAVKLFRIHSGFYIAIAQEQLHLSPYKLAQEYEEPIRFIGCAVFKFLKGHERKIKYHQFIRLPFNPFFVHYYSSINTNNVTANVIIKPTEDHYLVFSVDRNWNDVGSPQAYSFIWSPLNDRFWPYKMPRGVEVGPKPGIPQRVVKFPTDPMTVNYTEGIDYIGHVESCFHQLQRLLAERDLQSRRLIDSSRSLWRSPESNGPDGNALTNISAQVIVHGDVLVRGSLIESPKISLIGGSRPPEVLTIEKVSNQVSSHSPAIVENSLRQASYKLAHIRDKLSRAVPTDMPPDSAAQFDSQINFYGVVQADKVIFKGSGIANSNVRLNGIPFRQLEHELVSLNGIQDIGNKVKFLGKVVADTLEIHGIVNGQYQMKDAIDITSPRVQVIDISGRNNMIRPGPNPIGLDLRSVSTPDVILSYNATVNGIRLNDFITRDNRTQYVFGRKSFKRLSATKLDLAHAGVALNNFNLSRISTKAIRLRDIYPQRIAGIYATFSKPVHVNKLVVSNFINQHINMSSFIYDSVKTNDVNVQQIYGHKNFLRGLKVAHLTTDGFINGIKVNQIFNLNPHLPLPDYQRYMNSSYYAQQASITGRFTFRSPVNVHGNLNAGLINGIDISRRAIRRVPARNMATLNNPQIVHGTKIFAKPLRVLEKVSLLNQQQLSTVYPNSTLPTTYPLVNGIDLRRINAGLARQMQNPPMVYIDNLEVEGNLNLPTTLLNTTGTPRTTIGNNSICPLDSIRTKLILAGPEDQFIDIPVRVSSLRARSIQTGSRALNGMSFPGDFVLRSALNQLPRGGEQVELVMGHKSFEYLSVAPSVVLPNSFTTDSHGRIVTNNSPNIVMTNSLNHGVFLGSGSSINNVSYAELQTFLANERQRNSTGEKVFNTLNVHGNIYAKRINGYYWPDDILLKSMSSFRGQPTSPYLHKRIYSPLVFLESSMLKIQNQLVLRGPIQLSGRMNGVNLTEFAQQSATYGDKDLLSIGRPIRNKVFLGGLTVRGEIRSQGLIDGVNFDEMKNRVVTIGPRGAKIRIMSQKIFMSDIDFVGPVNMIHLNDLPIDYYINRIRFEPDGNTIKVFGKKTITGSIKIGKDLIVRGLINRIDFVDLKARAISLAPSPDEIQFNKTLTIEGDVFMDNLLIDEKNGVIDGMKLVNLLPIENIGKNELIITNHQLTRSNLTGGPIVKVNGAIQDCQISCSLGPAIYLNKTVYPQLYPMQGFPQVSPRPPVPLFTPTSRPPPPYPSQVVSGSYPAQPIPSNARGFGYMRTTPPYDMSSPRIQPPRVMMVYKPQPQAIQSLAMRRPVSIQYEQQVTSRKLILPPRSPDVLRQLNILRDQLVSLKLIRSAAFSDLVVGFIEATANDISSYSLPEQDAPHSDHIVNPKSFIQLDQIDFPFRPTTYHLSVGMSTLNKYQNITSVFSSVGGGQLHQLSVLPIESPNSAMFLRIAEQQALFLLISQDYTVYRDKQARCSSTYTMRPDLNSIAEFATMFKNFEPSPVEGGIHVYLFHALQNSSSLSSAYFDLYQTIDLPAIDSFEKFSYHGSTYVLAVSRPTSRIYLLLLRGYSGFQVVSYLDTPLIEYVRVVYTADQKPLLIVYQSNGLHRLMESVII